MKTKLQLGLAALVLCAAAGGPLPALAQTCNDAGGALNGMANTCRNKKCEADRGENASNCPEDCQDPNTHVMAYYTQGMVCPKGTISDPDTVAELQQEIRAAVSSGKRVKPAGSAHSATGIICGDADQHVIRSSKLTDIGPVEPFQGNASTVKFEAGVKFDQLYEHLHQQGYSWGLAATGFGGITLGGAIATGAHGSSRLASATISDYVVELDVVNAKGELISYSEGTTGQSDPSLWKALKANLGLLGYVARARIKLEPQFNMNVKVLTMNEAQFVADGGVQAAVGQCDYVFLSWYPGNDLVYYLCGNRTTSPVTHATAQNRLFTPNLSGLEQAFAVPTLQSGICNMGTRCNTAASRIDKYRQEPPLVTTDNYGSSTANVTARYTDLTGYAHRMVNLDSKVFLRQPGLTQLEYEGGIPFSQIQGAVQYLKSIYARDGVCQPLIGTLMRFDRASNGTLMAGNHVRAGMTANEPMVHLEFVEYWGYEIDQYTFDNHIDKPYREIVTHLVENYNYWPHWGKNDEWVFLHPAVKARNAADVSTFNAQIAKLDPYGVFLNQWSRNNGFSAPQFGQDFKTALYGSCASVDSDGDGISNCTDPAPTQFNGFYTRIADMGFGDGFAADGHCRNARDWNEAQMTPERQQNIRAGWDYYSVDHSYHASSYGWNPGFTSSSNNRSWEALHSAEFTAGQAGRYCFSKDNGTTGTSITDGWNSCSQVYINKARITEQGYGATWKPTGCVTLNAGQVVRLDLYSRHHNANVSRNFISSPRWCYGGGSDCTPDRKFTQAEVKAISDSNNR